MQLIAAMIKNFRRMDPFATEVIYRGLQIACGLYALAFLFHFTAGRFGNLMATISCLNGALEAAPTVATGLFIVALICDLELKYRKGGGDDNT